MSKEDALFKIRPNEPKVNVQLRWISLFSSLVELRLLLVVLSYELGINGDKKLMETGMLLVKIDI